MLSGAAAFPTIAGYLVDAVAARLQSAGLDLPARRGMVPAPIVADDCQCGTLAVAVSRIFPSTDGKTEGGATATAQGIVVPTVGIPWPPFLVGEMQVAVLRCADIPDNGIPSADTLAGEAARVHADAYWTTVAVVCELDRLRRAGDIEDYEIRDAPFLEAAGGCQGAAVNLAVGVNFLCPCG